MVSIINMQFLITNLKTISSVSFDACLQMPICFINPNQQCLLFMPVTFTKFYKKPHILSPTTLVHHNHYPFPTPILTLSKILIHQKLKETGFAPSLCLSRFSRLSCGVCWMKGQEMLVYCHGGERFHYLLKPDNK